MHNLYGLAYKCPYLQRKDDCPLKEVDHLSFKEKVNWIDNLCLDKKRAIWVHHQVCPKK
jgi:hypothetical protein